MNDNRRIHNSKELLVFWEEIYGGLKPVWKRAFLGHSAIQGILSYKSEQIMVAVRRNKKLIDVLKDLHHQAQRREEFDRKQNPFHDSKQGHESSSKIERREIEGGRWGRSF
jgi:hypothetical protein